MSSETKTRFAITAAFVITLVIASSNFPTVFASTAQLDIMSVIYPSRVPYDQSIPVKIVVSFSGNFTPTVSIYYWILSNSTTLSSGWRIVEASPVAIIGEGAAIYSATLPSAVFGERLTYGMNVVFWIDAVLGSTANSTAQGAGLWNPNVLQGKFLVQITDPYAPTIQSISLTPQQPTSSDDVTVQVSFAKNCLGANMSEAQLEYSLDAGVTGTTLNMTQFMNNTFLATIPAQSTGSQVSYRYHRR